MFKTVLKKEFDQLTYNLFQTRTKNNKAPSRKSFYLIASLLLLIAFSFGFIIYEIAAQLGENLFGPGNIWLYFAVMSMYALMFGLFGGVFTTYSTLFKAKDNELLLSLPIKPFYILCARLLSIYLTSLFFCSIVWVPTAIYFWQHIKLDALKVILPCMLLFFLALLVSVLSCLLGWLVALFSGKLRSKTFATVIFSFLLLGVYYFLYFKTNEIIQDIIINIDKIGKAINGWIYPIYLLGKGAGGDIIGALLFILISLAAFAVCFYLLSKTFISIVTRSERTAFKKYVSGEQRSSGKSFALFNREFKQFITNATYITNAGLGIVIMLVLAVLAVINRGMLLDFSNYLEKVGIGKSFIIAALPGVIGLLASMNAISAPSVSLEGKSVWIIRSLPVDTWSVLKAKESLHTVLNFVPSVVLYITVGVILKSDIIPLAVGIVYILLNILFCADLGLILNLYRNDLDWTNEAVPIKQSSSVMFSMLGGWLVSALSVGIAFILKNILPIYAVIIINALLIATGAFILRRFLRKKGVPLFEKL